MPVMYPKGLVARPYLAQRAASRRRGARAARIRDGGTSYRGRAAAPVSLLANRVSFAVILRPPHALPRVPDTRTAGGSRRSHRAMPKGVA